MQIAEASGLPAARTIRFYIARGLLSGPVKGGRSAAYTAEHLACLERIKRLQAAGQTLADIARTLSGPSGEEAEMVAATAWLQYALADDVVVWVRAGASPWRAKQVRAAVDEFARRIRQSKNGKGKERNRESHERHRIEFRTRCGIYWRPPALVDAAVVAHRAGVTGGRAYGCAACVSVGRRWPAGSDLLLSAAAGCGAPGISHHGRWLRSAFGIAADQGCRQGI